MKKKLVLEIITEEMPPKSLMQTIKSLYKNIKTQIQKKSIKYEKINWHATSRRLIIEIKNIFYNNKYIKNFIKKNNTKKKKILNFSKNLHNDLKFAILVSIKNMYIKKPMHWNKMQIKFIRPIRNILCMLEYENMNIEVLKIHSKNYTFGHFFMTNNKKIHIKNASEYKKKIKKVGKVIISFNERKNKILESIKNKIKKIKGIIKKNESLIEEINFMTEWPQIYIGRFKKKFLKIPSKLIKYVIENIQKCFSIYSKTKEITRNFVIISNIKSINPKRIISDNERIINEKLTDIKFFLKLDRKNELINNLKKLKKHIFHYKLGTFFEKTIRIKKVACWIGKTIKINEKDIIQASLLSKCDLLTNIVFEFPSMQGYIGMKYALAEGKTIEIANSIKEQYYPLNYNSKISKNNLSSAISISDRIDTIVGLFISGEQPFGKNDPFYIRKNAIGIIRILLENKFQINILELIKISIFTYKKKDISKTIETRIVLYFYKRIIAFFKKYNFENYILSSSIKIFKIIPIKIYLHSLEITNYKNIKIFKNTCKRIKNILKKNKQIKLKKIFKKFINNQIENKLYNLLIIFRKNVKNMLENGEYKNIFEHINIICKVINILFKKIFINDKNKNIKNNRILLLKKTNYQFNKIIILKNIV
ncbi:glycine--tRNA ligase subunit beta [Buchnera aphidicola (Chaitoregma tattakana)]|uniref:glycine--tRNA ligase subunit beta n=1 Tax=Buchnera aphidicola TaxID=9 RepID=UPI0031B8A534